MKQIRKYEYFLGLGANLGDRKGNLEKAEQLLKETGTIILGRSSVYETEPVGVEAQPWFYNRVLHVSAGIPPLRMLNVLQGIEKKMGRQTKLPGGQPRVIDIDILLCGEKIVRTKKLTLPHPRLAQRNFVLFPLAEIAPGAVHPIEGKTAALLLRESTDKAAVNKISGVK